MVTSILSRLTVGAITNRCRWGWPGTGTAICDFVIHTNKGQEVINITFDAPYWNTELSPSLTSFFQAHIIPEILRDQHSITPPADLVSFENSDEDAVTLPPEQSLVIDKIHPTDSSPILCALCTKFLPENDNICADNSNASVGCECSVCKCDA